MRASSTTIILATLVIFGCRMGQRSIVKDHRLHDNGKPKVASWTAHVSHADVNYGEGAEFFEDGRLKQVSWWVDGRPVTVLRFHPNGQLRAEERFSGNQMDFAAYYDDRGTLERTVGQRLGWATRAGI